MGDTPVSDQFPGNVPGNYVVSAGDTLRGIALAMFGDAQLWYLIADANGLKSDADLRVGLNLVMPNKVTNLRNAHDTFKPYEPGKIIGDTTPTLPNPPPPPAPKKKSKKGCGGVGAIVATVMTAGAAAIAMGAASSSVGVMSAGMAALGGSLGAVGFGAAVIGGVVGSVVSQGVGMALGMQDKFSWSGVAMSAIGAGIGASGLGNAVSGAVSRTLGEFGGAIAAGMVSNVVGQGLGIAVGAQKSFSWASVAGAAVGSAVGYGVGQLTKGIDSSLVRGTLSGLANGAARAAVSGGRVNWGAVAADAFGNAIGNSIVGGSTAVENAQQVQGLRGAGGLTAEQQAIISRGGYSEEDYWNSPATTQADRYAQNFGGDAINVADRVSIGSGDLLSIGNGTSAGDEEVERIVRAKEAAYRENKSDPLGRSDGVYQGNDVWSYPVSLGDDIEMTVLPSGIGSIGATPEPSAGSLWNNFWYQNSQNIWADSNSAPRGFKLIQSLNSVNGLMGGMVNLGQTMLADWAVTKPRIVQEMAIGAIAASELIFPQSAADVLPVGKAGRLYRQVDGKVGERVERELAELIGGHRVSAPDAKWTPHPEFQKPAADKGRFVGDTGNSNFALSDAAADAMGVPRGSLVPWRQGIPDFGQYAVPGPGGMPSAFNVPKLMGEHGTDRTLMLQQMANETGMSQREISRWLSANDVRLHHAGGEAVQVVPTRIHSLHHSGGAQQLRGGN